MMHACAPSAVMATPRIGLLFLFLYISIGIYTLPLRFGCPGTTASDPTPDLAAVPCSLSSTPCSIDAVPGRLLRAALLSALPDLVGVAEATADPALHHRHAGVGWSLLYAQVRLGAGCRSPAPSAAASLAGSPPQC